MPPWEHHDVAVACLMPASPAIEVHVALGSFFFFFWYLPHCAMGQQALQVLAQGMLHNGHRSVLADAGERGSDCKG
jgi:hypothetical protein